MGNKLNISEINVNSDFDLNNKKLINLSKILLGSSSSVFSYPLEINNCNYTAGFLGNNQSGIKLTGNYSVNYYNSIDFLYDTTSTAPNGKLSFQFTGSGSFFVLGTSNNYSTGITHVPLTAGYYTSELDSGIRITNSIFFANNNTGSIGTSSSAVANIYSVNSLNITSDIREKNINNKINLDLSFDLLKDIVKNIISWTWKDTFIPSKKEIKLIKELDKETNKMQYSFKEIILEEEKKIKHSRSHIGFNLNELYKIFVKNGYSTKDLAFISIEEKYFDQIEKKEKNSFDEKGNPILFDDETPKGKLTFKVNELMPFIFIYLNKLFDKNTALENKLKDIDKKIEILENKLKDIDKKI